ncbi:hypothetical protein U9R90_02810 [Streptomyces sp. E11-3]|uniref:hypothetical protein n=1 Tax=Streptomyces sp. E11-3 TaxID=3110112 RepID=UPI00398129DE
MTGADEAFVDDALHVLTAVLLTPAQFPSVLGDDYAQACAALGLTPVSGGYGLVLGQDGHGARWTVAVDDVSLVAVAIASWDCGMEYDLSPDEHTVVATLGGWPLPLAVAAPGVPAPHDPEPEPGEAEWPVLVPPDAGGWGPAQRRLGADEIARQWATWREQLDDADFASDSTTPAAETDESAEINETSEAAEAAPRTVRQVLDAARAYTVTPPPLGRVRSSFASQDARTLRVDGPGWSLVARTDDIAFVLLDEEPRQVLPVGRGPELSGLLAALDLMAVRPS